MRVLLSVIALLVAGVAVWAVQATISPAPSTEESEAGTTLRETPAESTSAREVTSDEAWFTEVTGTGIDFKHVSGSSAEKPFPAANGSGLAAIDYDLDGWHDLYFATGRPFPLDSLETGPSNRIYRNLGGWKFRDVTTETGLGYFGYSAGLAVGDYNSDGFSDVFVCCYGADCLFQNQGDGTFRKSDASVADERWGTSAAFFDYDADGLLDLYVCNYAKWTWETNEFCGDRVTGHRMYCSPRSVEPEPDALFRNLGNGSFEDVSQTAGLAERMARAQGVVAADVNGDGRTDLYIGNDLHPNFLFLNLGNGTFEDVSELSGAAYDYQGSAQAGMGVDCGDADRDGNSDLFVTNFADEHNAFYHNDGNGIFQDVSHQRGLAEESLPWVGWGTMFADFNLDGWLDVVVANGHVDDNRHLVGQDSKYAQPPLLWENNKGQFSCVGPSAGTYFARNHVGRGLALADFDKDGDYDFAVSHQDTSPALLRNDASGREEERTSISLQLIGTVSNRDAVGSTIRAHAHGRTALHQVKGGGSYLSAHDLRQIIATGTDADLEVEVQWPKGHRSILLGIKAGGHYRVVEPKQPSDPTHSYPVRHAND